MTIQDIYEKMLQDPKNRKRSHIKQPMPSQAEIMGIGGKDVDTSSIPEEKRNTRSNYLSEEEESAFASIDKRMEQRWNGQRSDADAMADAINEGVTKKIAKLEKQVSEMQELMIEMMKTHMKLLEK